MHVRDNASYCTFQAKLMTVKISMNYGGQMARLPIVFYAHYCFINFLLECITEYF